MAINEKYSFKDFTDQTFTDVPAEEFNNTEIVGSCFYQQNKPDCKVFPNKMTGVTFRRCNLDNVYIPPGNTVITEGWEKCTCKKLKAQNDNNIWILDDELNPVEPINKKELLAEGKSIDPKDIPTEHYKEFEISKEEWNKTYALGKIPEDSWFREIPEIVETRSMLDTKTMKVNTIYKVKGKAWVYRGQEKEVK